MTEARKLTSPSETRALLKELGIRPSKARGQNFLIDRNILDIVLHAADIQPSDSVLEIGSGLGVVTHRLIKQAGHVSHDGHQFARQFVGH